MALRIEKESDLDREIKERPARHINKLQPPLVRQLATPLQNLNFPLIRRQLPNPLIVQITSKRRRHKPLDPRRETRINQRVLRFKSIFVQGRQGADDGVVVFNRGGDGGWVGPVDLHDFGAEGEP